MGKTNRKASRKGEQKNEPYRKPKNDYDRYKGTSQKDHEDLYEDFEVREYE